VSAATTATSIDELVRGWPKTPQESARTVAEKYGLPDEASESFLVWHARGPWKRTVLWRDEVEHRFPTPHKDVLEQVIDYRVPPELASELVAFDGSVVVERTRGELSARCEGEEANFLALNLANDIVTGKLGAAEARDEYTRNMQAFSSGKKPEYMQRLVFQPPAGGTPDPDEPTMEGS
jgi:hypothetical protein